MISGHKHFVTMVVVKVSKRLHGKYCTPYLESAAIVRVSIGVERLRALALEKEGERRKRNFSSPNLIAAIHRCSLHFLVI